MNKQIEEAVENTDIKLWEGADDYGRSVSVHVTKSGGIGIDVSGYVIVRSPQEWHLLHTKKPTLEQLMKQQVIVEPKPAVQSKSHWFNIISGVVSVAAAGAIPQPYGMVVLAVGNIILRQWFTAVPIKGIV